MALACFRTIRDLLPARIAEVNDLSTHVLTKRDEFAQEFQTRQLQRRRRTRSIGSEPTGEGEVTAPTSFTRHQSADQCSHSITRQKLRLPASSQPPSYHSQPLSTSTIESRFDGESTQAAQDRRLAQSGKNRVVTYDGYTQQVLERLVREIWSAKSSIRTARISDSMKTGFRGRNHPRAFIGKSYRELLSSRKADSTVVDDETEKERTKNARIFDFVENQLDIAQNICESAAHQFLRQGDCTHELDVVLGIFDLVLEASTNATQRLETEEESRRLEEQQAQENERQRELEEAAATAMDALVCADDPDVKLKRLSKLDDNILEVDDDSSASSVSIDISAFRLTRFGGRPHLPFSIAH